MKLGTIKTFIPSGDDFERAKLFFLDFGFSLDWEGNGLVGLSKDKASFILQDYDKKEFAENLMVSVEVADLDAFWEEIKSKKLDQKYDVKLKQPTDFPYGREVHLIDLAGVCWHFRAE